MNNPLPKSLIKIASVFFLIAILMFLVSSISEQPLIATFQPETFRSPRVHPINFSSGRPQPLFVLDIKNTTKTVQTDEMEIVITLVSLSKYFYEKIPSGILFQGDLVDRNHPPSIADGFFIEIEFHSDSFRIFPSSIKIPLIEGYLTSFIATPTSQGTKKILVNSRLETPRMKNYPYGSLPLNLEPFDTTVLTVEVTPARTIGFSSETVSVLQTISGIIGLPSLIILVIDQIIARKNKRRKRKPN